MPSGVKASLMPSGSNQRPIQPFGAYSVASAMPATVVGSANGRSTIVGCRSGGAPGTSSAPAPRSPENRNTMLTSAAISEAPKVSRYEATTSPIADGLPEIRPAHVGGLEDQRRQRQQHDQAKIENRVAKAQIEAGSTLCFLNAMLFLEHV